MNASVRRLILFFLVAVEIALIVALRTVGWTATTAIFRWLLCAFAAIIPACAALVVLLYRGRRFGLRSLLLAFLFFALFLSVSVMPLLNASRQRSASRHLVASGIAIQHTPTMVDDLRANLGFEPISVTQKAFADDESIPPWLLPLAGDLFRHPVDSSIRQLWVDSDSEILVLCSEIDRLTNLESVSFSGPGVTADGLSRFVNSTTIGNRARLIHTYNVHLPEDFFARLGSVETLVLDAFSASGPDLRFALTENHKRHLATLPHLQVLIIRGYRILDRDLDVLAECDKLKYLGLHKTSVSQNAVGWLIAAMPRCQVAVTGDD